MGYQILGVSWLSIQIIATPTVLENFPDVDICLEARAKAVIELAEAISLKEAADKAEERQRQQREAEEKYEEIANQRRPNSYSLRHVAPSPSSSYISHEKGATHYYAGSTPESTEEEWKQPESIAEVVEMLDFCEDSETLALIRLQSIPSEVFKIAAE